MRRLCAAVLLALTLSSPAAAGEQKDVGQYVDIQPVGLPIVADGRLVNYVFVHVRLNLAGSANVSRLRDKEPYFRDALVRAAHRSPFTLPTDLQHVDEAKLKATMMREAAAIAGRGQVRSVTLTSQAAQRAITPAMLGL